MCQLCFWILAATFIAGCSHKPIDTGIPGLSSGPVVSSFRLRPYRQIVLKNGLHVLMVEDSSLPYFALNLMIKSGSSSDPASLPGVASMVASLLDKGTKDQSAVQIAGQLGQIGAEFNASASYDYTMITGSTLSMYQDVLLSEMAKIITQPQFTQVELNRARKQMISGIERLPDSPPDFSDRAFSEYIYGTHPYGHPVSGTLASMRMIKRKDVIEYYLHHYRPDNAWLAVIGKFTPDIQAKIEVEFGAWQPRDLDQPKLLGFPQVSGPGMEVVTKPGIVQSQIVIGGPGIRRQDPQFLPLRLANVILGGAFSSRLNNKIRVDMGLTYSIWSSFDSRLDTGPFAIETFTRNEKVGETIKSTLALVQDFHDKGVSAQEVAEAKNFLIGSFPAAIETAERLSFNLLLLRLYGISDDYLSDYISNMNEVSADQVNEAIHGHFDPKTMKVFVYTDRQVLPQLKKLGIPMIVKSFRQIQ